MTKTSEFTTFYRLDREDIAAIEQKAESDQNELADELEKRIAHCEKEIGHFRELHLQLHSQICRLEDELNQLKRLAIGINRKESEPSPEKAEESSSDRSVPYIGQKIKIDEVNVASLLGQNADQRHERVWTVLDISADQKSCLVMCDESVHSMPYQWEMREIGWRSCDLRKWLNRAYCNVLSKSVANYVKVFPVNNRVQDRNTPTNPFYFTTDDKIFVLSEKECERYKRLIPPTDEACWLRTPGECNGMVLAMKGNEIIGQSAMQDGGIRPAMWIGTDCEVFRK